MTRLESTIEDVHDGRAIHQLPGEWDRTAKVLVEEIDRLRAELAECRAKPPAPAAVVRVGAWDGLLTRRLVLFADAAAASEFYAGSDGAYDIFISPDTEIVWHPAVAPDDPAPAAVAELARKLCGARKHAWDGLQGDEVAADQAERDEAVWAAWRALEDAIGCGFGAVRAAEAAAQEGTADG